MRLQKTGLCVSHCSTIRLVDKMGDNFDKDVKEWCRVLTKKVLKVIIIAPFMSLLLLLLLYYQRIIDSHCLHLILF